MFPYTEEASPRPGGMVSPLSSITSILSHYSALFEVPLCVLERVFGDICRQIDEALYNQPLAQLDTNIKFKVRLCRVLEGILDKSAALTELLPPTGLYDDGVSSRRFTIFCDNYAGATDIDNIDQQLSMSGVDAYLCPCCEKLMLLPVVLHPCGHTICRFCLEVNTATASNTSGDNRPLCLTICPTCNLETTFAYYNHELHQKLRNRFTFNCAFLPEGCIFKGLLSNLESHIKICPYALKEQEKDEDTIHARLRAKERQLCALEADVSLYLNLLRLLQNRNQEFEENIQRISLTIQRLADAIPLPKDSMFRSQLAKINQDIAANSNNSQHLAVKLQILSEAVRDLASNVPSKQPLTSLNSDQSGNIALIQSLEGQLLYYKQALTETDHNFNELMQNQGPLKQEVEVQRAAANESKRIASDLAAQLSLVKDQLTAMQKSCSCAIMRTCNEELAAENKRMQLTISNLQRTLGDLKQEAAIRSEEMETYKGRLVKLMMDTNELANTLVKFQLLTAEQSKHLREMASQLQLFYSGKPVCYDCGCKIESVVIDQSTIVYTTTELTRQSERILSGITVASLGVGTSQRPDAIKSRLFSQISPSESTQAREDFHIPASDKSILCEQFMEDDLNIDITAITLLRYLFHPKILRGGTKLENFANECKMLLRKAIDKNADTPDEERLSILYQLLAKLRHFYANDYPLDEVLNFLTRFQLESSPIMRDQFGVEARRSIMEGYKKVRTENRVLKATLNQIQEKKSTYHTVLAEKNRRTAH